MEPQEEAECIAELLRQRVAAEVSLAAHCQEYQPHVNEIQKQIYDQLLPGLQPQLQHQALQQQQQQHHHQELQQQQLLHQLHQLQHQHLQQQLQYHQWHYPPESIAYPQEIYSEQYRKFYLANGITHQEDLDETRKTKIREKHNSIRNCTENKKDCVVPRETEFDVEDCKNAHRKRKKITPLDDDKVKDLITAVTSNNEANYKSPELLRRLSAITKPNFIPRLPPQEQLHHHAAFLQTIARSVTPSSLIGWDFFAVGTPDLSNVTNDWIIKLIPVDTDEGILEISGPAVSEFLKDRR